MYRNRKRRVSGYYCVIINNIVMQRRVCASMTNDISVCVHYACEIHGCLSSLTNHGRIKLTGGGGWEGEVQYVVGASSSHDYQLSILTSTDLCPWCVVEWEERKPNREFGSRLFDEMNGSILFNIYISRVLAKNSRRLTGRYDVGWSGV